LEEKTIELRITEKMAFDQAAAIRKKSDELQQVIIGEVLAREGLGLPEVQSVRLDELQDGKIVVSLNGKQVENDAENLDG